MNGQIGQIRELFICRLQRQVFQQGGFAGSGITQNGAAPVFTQRLIRVDGCAGAPLHIGPAGQEHGVRVALPFRMTELWIDFVAQPRLFMDAHAHIYARHFQRAAHI